MKNILFFPFLFCVLLITSCGGDDEVVNQITTDLEVKFTATYDGVPLEMLKEYTMCDGRKMRIDIFRFFISDVVLLTETDPQGPVTDLLEIDFIDLTKNSVADAEAGEVLNIQKVPVGDYSGIQLGLGVAADLNRTKPEDYGSTHPLQEDYWSDWGSYIFATTAGFADFNNDGVLTVGTGASEVYRFHNGSDDAYAISTNYKDISLKEGIDGAIHLNLEVSSIFNITNDQFDVNQDGCLDIVDFPSTHSGLPVDVSRALMSDMMSKLANSITVEL